MGKIRKAIVLFVAAIGVLLVAYLVLRAIASFNQGYSWKEMDWQQRGHTSIIDFFVASDIGKREAVQNGQKCIEYYAFKDGLPVKMVCPEQRNLKN